jgi:chaperone required for assembly of F1-ATPase
MLPSRALAEAVADEWRAQGERIDPLTMPLTRLANSVIDGVVGREEAVIDDIMSHAASDLLCYRAKAPQALVKAQEAHWDPVLAWAKEALGAPLTLAEGVKHVAQPEPSLGRLRKALVGRDAFSLAALHVMTALTGSALLALAVARGRLTPEQAWKAAHVDEDWQISQWGEDAEAKLRRENRRRDFEAAAKLLELVRE